MCTARLLQGFESRDSSFSLCAEFTELFYGFKERPHPEPLGHPVKDSRPGVNFEVHGLSMR